MDLDINIFVIIIFFFGDIWWSKDPEKKAKTTQAKLATSPNLEFHT